MGWKRTARSGSVRVLALFCGAFSAGVFLAQYALPVNSLLPCAALSFAAACARLLLPGTAGKRLLLTGTGLALALGWNWLYVQYTAAPAAALSGTAQSVEMTLQDYPSPAPYGIRAAVRVAGVPGLAVWYGDGRYAALRPGQVVRDTVRLQDAGHVREDDLTVFTSRGVFLLAYGQRKSAASSAVDESVHIDNTVNDRTGHDSGNNSFGNDYAGNDSHVDIESADFNADSFGGTVKKGTSDSMRWAPARMGKAVREKISALLRGDEAAFLSALLTGDRSGLSIQAATDLEEAGLTHVLAVSGMHCGFLLALLAVCIGRQRRRLLALCAVPILIFFAFLTGGRPSVVRACVMLFFLLAAPLFNRESDALTAVAAALFLILLHNPYAAASVSLQLSFAAVAGLLWLTPKVYRFLADWIEEIPWFRREKGNRGRYGETGKLETGKLENGKLETRKQEHGRQENGQHALRVPRRLAFFLAASLAASLGAMAFTAPLSGAYFGVLPLAAPLSGVLCLWAVGAAFVTGLLAVGIGFLVPALGPWAAIVPGLLIRYILAIAHTLGRMPGHALYFANPLLKYWLAFAYVLLAAAYFSGKLSPMGKAEAPSPWAARRKAVLTAALLLVTLLCAVTLYRTQYRHDLDIVALDVGQGQSVLLASGGRYALADCGSGNSWYDAGAIAARKLKTIGCRRLDFLLLTHFDADHVNGLEALLARLPVRELLVPQAAADAENAENGTAEDAENETASGTKEENRTGDSGREAVLSLAARYGVTVRTVTAREVLPFGRAALTVLPPVGASGDNDRGLSLLCTAGQSDFLLTGDMGQAAEKKLLSAFALPDLEAAMAGHHGSRYSTCDALLDALTPEIVCVSVGSNSYGHPAPETLDRLAAHGCAVYRTDRDGDIHLVLDG